jgi:3-isopropylmalate dehydratase small subunit
MSLYREDFSLPQGLILVLMAVSALVSINFARIYGRQMGNDSLVRLVRESLKEAKEQHEFQGEELWLQWWIDEVSKESERLQDELERRKFEKVGELTDTAPEESQLPLKPMLHD